MLTLVVCASSATLLKYYYVLKYHSCFIKYRFCVEKHVTALWSRFAFIRRISASFYWRTACIELFILSNADITDHV